VKDSLPALSDSLTTCAGRVLMEQKIELRAWMAVLSIQGIAPRTIAVACLCVARRQVTQRHHTTVHRWACRVEEGDLLTDLPRSGRPRKFSEAARLMTIAIYCQQSPPLPGVHLWSLRDAHRYFDAHPEILGARIGRATIRRILQEHALRPHRRKYYLQITDPDFFPKMEHIIELYLNPPHNLFCFDECTCVQALKRVSPDMPPDTGRPVQEDFDYHRNGTTDLMAFLNPGTGAVYGQCVPNHDRHTLARVFTAHVETLPADAVLHYVMDNLSPHYHDDFCQTVADLCGVSYTPLKKGEQRRAWLRSEDKRIVVHFVPFHASWLNMIEIWFGILKSKCLKYGHLESIEQLCEDILAFIGTWNAHFAHPFSWSYTGDGLHAKVVRRFCRLLAIETDQMDSGFLRKQLLLMTNLAENYIDLIPAPDWHRLIDLATKKHVYITRIIENDTKLRSREAAQKAYARFRETIVVPQESLAKTG
jgi:transposase